MRDTQAEAALGQSKGTPTNVAGEIFEWIDDPSEIWKCPECGSAVSDTAKHQQFHDKLKETK